MSCDELRYLIEHTKINSNEILYKKLRKVEPKSRFETIILKYYMKELVADNSNLQTENDTKLYFK